MNRLFLMCGIAFSGKSTLARELNQELGASIISLDEINDRRGLGGNDEVIVDEEWVKTHAIAHSEMKMEMRKGRDIVLDDTNCFRWLRDRYRSLARDQGYEAVVIHMDVDPELARERLARNAVQGERKGLPLEYFLEHAAKFEKPDPDERCLAFLPGTDPRKWIVENFGGR